VNENGSGSEGENYGREMKYLRILSGTDDDDADDDAEILRILNGRENVDAFVLLMIFREIILGIEISMVPLSLEREKHLEFLPGITLET
jgi:hypothetical protein